MLFRPGGDNCHHRSTQRLLLFLSPYGAIVIESINVMRSGRMPILLSRTSSHHHHHHRHVIVHRRPTTKGKPTIVHAYAPTEHDASRQNEHPQHDRWDVGLRLRQVAAAAVRQRRQHARSRRCASPPRPSQRLAASRSSGDNLCRTGWRDIYHDRTVRWRGTDTQPQKIPTYKLTPPF